MKFVDKQLALKLKDKGFDRPCFGYYFIEDKYETNLHKNITCGGFQWKYKGSEKEIKNLIIKILQFDKKNNYINTYNSLAEASKLTGISRTAISNCLSNLSNTAGGYIWRKN